MTNSDYLLKAAIKKLTEKLNSILTEKIEEAAIIAQDAPEIIKKEIDSLKDSIIEEATRMENEETSENNDESNYRDPNINEALDELKNISESIDKLNEKINKQTL